MSFVFTRGPRYAIDDMRGVVRQLSSLQVHTSDHPSRSAERLALLVSTIEHAVRCSFRDSSLWKELLTPRYFQLLRDSAGMSGFGAMLAAEAEYQLNRLMLVLDEAEAIQKSLALVDVVVVPDTNVLMHFKPLNNIDWCKLLDAKTVRIFLPSRVIEELDAKKYTGPRDIPDRAQQAIRELNSVLGDEPATIRPGVSIQSEALFDSPRSSPDADAAILETCLELMNLARDVRLATGDLGMQLRAKRLGITRLPLSEDLRRNPPTAIAK